jgi:protease I
MTMIPGLMFGATAAADEKAGAGGSTGADKPLTGVKVAILTGEGFQDAEAMMPLAYLTNRGADVTVLGPNTGQVKAYNSDVTLLIEKDVADASVSDFDTLVLPGGHAPSKIRQNDAVVRFAREFFKSGKPVAAICHGPQVLITAGLVEGKTMTCYSEVADELRKAGADYRDKPVVREDNLVTSRNPDDIPAWLAAMEKLILETRKQSR